jgi:parallel beta helix pectate lyase-like protein
MGFRAAGEGVVRARISPMRVRANRERGVARNFLAAMALASLGLHCSSKPSDLEPPGDAGGDRGACRAGEACGPCASDGGCPLDAGGDVGHASDSGSHDGHASGDGATPKDGPATDAPVVPIVPAFYVSTTGNDSNAGTLTSPFATLGRAQMAMQGSTTIKTTYIRAGSYTLPTIADCGGSSCGLNLTKADDGETWSYYPPDGVDSADFTGGSTSSGTGLVTAMSIGAQNVTINGLSIHDFQYAGIGSGGGTGNLTVENSVLFNGYVASGSSNPAGISCYGCSNMTISHNVIHDIAQFGISISNVNGEISNLLVTGNVFYNTCTAIADCGALYVQDVTATATNIRWTNNYIHDGNMFATLGSGYGSALYADDCTSNVTASGNVLTGRNGSNTSMVHGGSNVHQVGNLTDLATFQQHVATFQTSGVSGCSSATMSGNEYENNIIIGAGGGGGYALLSGSPMHAPTITSNDYYNYGGTAISSAGAYSDADPVSEDPQISGWTYDIASTSPVFKAPVSFTALVGGWGPPGYVLPETGTPPSSPH